MAFFGPQYKLHIHTLQVILIHIIMGLTVPRIFMKNQPRTRATTIALGMSAKSMIIISYQLITTHVARFRKWRSLKAYAILNGLEVVFWAAVVFLVIQANIQVCIGTGCYLSWAVVGVAVVLTFVEIYMAVVSYLEFRSARGPGVAARKLESRDTEARLMVRRGRHWEGTATDGHPKHQINDRG